MLGERKEARVRPWRPVRWLRAGGLRPLGCAGARRKRAICYLDLNQFEISHPRAMLSIRKLRRLAPAYARSKGSGTSLGWVQYPLALLRRTHPSSCNSICTPPVPLAILTSPVLALPITSQHARLKASSASTRWPKWCRRRTLMEYVPLIRAVVSFPVLHPSAARVAGE